jgi:ATP-dependent helicase/nuclease subunit B
MAAMASTPRVFTIPASAPFLPTLVHALLQDRLGLNFRPGRDPLALADVTLYLPTRRAARHARDAFLSEIGGDAAILPRIVPIGDPDADEIEFSEAALGEIALDVPEALGGFERQILLTELILSWSRRIQPRDPGQAALIAGTPAAAFALAADLARLMDDMTTRQVPWDRLDELVPEEVDRYWQLTLDFLKIAREHWPAILAERGLIEPAARRDRLIEAECRRLQHARGPVIAAGSTGSMPSTAALLEAVAHLSNGAVILPGLDTDLDDEAWDPIGGNGADLEPAQGHPQFAMHGLLRRIGTIRGAVGVLGASPQGRERVVSEALRPAAATDRWQTTLNDPDFVAQAASAMTKVAAIEAASAEEEAMAIAVVLREAQETPGKTAALVTPDRALARRVLAALSRWSVPVEDSGGDALPDTPPGVFARLVAQVALGGAEPGPLLALLKHPLCELDRRAVATLELAVLRGPRPNPGCAALEAALTAFRHNRDSLHRSDVRRRIGDDEIGEAAQLIASLAKALHGLEAIKTPTPLALIASRHREAIETLGTLTEDLAKTFEEIEAAGTLVVSPSDYADLFHAAAAARTVRRPEQDVRIRIFGPLEARLQNHDLVVLGGMVEGVWPPETQTDPWLSRPMRHALGLDLPERRIGLSAHDFAQLFGGPEVVLSRAAKLGGAPTVPSRLVQRLSAVVGPAQWDAALARGARYAGLAARIDEPAEPPRAARQPAPQPPLEARPRRLSVTEVEDWLRDPYTIYAKHILKLSPLDPVDMPLSAADRGSAIHNALGEFTQEFATALPGNTASLLREIGQKHFAPLMERPEARALWWPRYLRIVAWFAEWERTRRDGVASILAETYGSMTLPAEGRTFRLSARADRIETRSDGRFAILDYKTGSPPTGKQVRIGLSPQLTLTAAILRDGGFDGIAADMSVSELTYVRLSGNNPPGEERILELTRDRRSEPPIPPDQAADEARQKLQALILAFENEEQPYHSLVLSMWSKRYGTYDDLARIKEWSSGREDEI